MRKTSFYDLWEMSGESNPQPLEQDIANTRSTTIYSKAKPDFWEKLSELSNADPKGLGELLGVDTDQVATWHSKIKQIAGESERAAAEREQDSMIQTGV